VSNDRRIYIRFVDEDKTFRIRLNESLAPNTCRTIWDALAKPVRVTAFHAMFAGPEIMTGLPEEAQTFDPTAIPAENQTCFPGAGDCLWFYQGKNSMKGLADELWEIGIFYDEGGRVFGPLGWTPVNIFGKVEDDIEGFAETCRDIRLKGAKLVEYGRV
jgi:hypothetical protein